MTEFRHDDSATSAPARRSTGSSSLIALPAGACVPSDPDAAPSGGRRTRREMFDLALRCHRSGLNDLGKGVAVRARMPLPALGLGGAFEAGSG